MLLRYGEGNRSAIVAIEKTVLLAAPRRWGEGVAGYTLQDQMRKHQVIQEAGAETGSAGQGRAGRFQNC